MSETVRCPDCGHENAPDAESCAACGFPLREVAIAPPAPEPQAAPPSPIVLPPRPRRRPPRGSNQAVSLWLVFGSIMALVVVFVAVKTNLDRSQPPVEGANPVQQGEADSLRMAIAKDSTSVAVRVRLGDVLFDTGNWSEAIVQYRSAIRQDSTLVNAIVDLGVCYYNLGDAQEAERHFRLGLERDPRHPIALFNLGIVCERRDDSKQALDYYHRALETNPPDPMKQSLFDAIARVQQKIGSSPKPLGG
jgi:tetratricopeptide (TPR) repeat protein